MSAVDLTISAFTTQRLLDHGAKLVLYSGTRPASIDLTYSNPALVSFDLPAGATVNGRVISWPAPFQAAATATGTPTWAAIKTSAGADIVHLPPTGIGLVPSNTTASVVCIVNSCTVSV